MSERIAVYPGSFDPVTYGHMDVAQRGAKVFDKVIMAIAVNLEKQPVFSVEERLEMLRASFGSAQNIDFGSFDGLLVDYTSLVGASAVIRGLRAITDFDFEMQMALMNCCLREDLTTVFLMPKEEHVYLSSNLVREIAQLGGDVSGLVHPFVLERLRARFDLLGGGGRSRV